jgi:hypothetical protein
MRPSGLGAIGAALLALGCSSGSVLVVTVDSSSPIAGIDRLRVVVDSGGQAAGPYDEYLPGRPATIPPAVSLSLSFDAGRSGGVDVTVQALSAAGEELATGRASATLSGGSQSVTIDLSRPAPPDGGADAQPDAVGDATPPPPPIRFAAPVAYALEGAGSDALVADFNRDGVPDVAVLVGASSNVNILLSKGNGTFFTRTSFNGPGVTRAMCLAAGDFNRDGILDLTLGTDFVPGNGDGTFPFVISGIDFMHPNPGPGCAAAVDFNRDGMLDLLFAPGDSAATPDPFTGYGGGSFGMQSPGSVPHLTALAIGDLDGDGTIDSAAVGPADSSLSVFKGTGSTMSPFLAVGTTATGAMPTAISLADLDRDGALDAVVARAGGVDLLRGGAALGFPFFPKVPYDCAGCGGAAAVADFDRDGIPDVVTRGVTVLRGRGDGTLEPPYLAGNAYPGGSLFLTADLNRDDKPDLVILEPSNAPGSVVVLLNVSP